MIYALMSCYIIYHITRSAYHNQYQERVIMSCQCPHPPLFAISIPQKVSSHNIKVLIPSYFLYHCATSTSDNQNQEKHSIQYQFPCAIFYDISIHYNILQANTKKIYSYHINVIIPTYMTCPTSSHYIKILQSIPIKCIDALVHYQMTYHLDSSTHNHQQEENESISYQCPNPFLHDYHLTTSTRNHSTHIMLT